MTHPSSSIPSSIFTLKNSSFPFFTFPYRSRSSALSTSTRTRSCEGSFTTSITGGVPNLEYV
jgi:hypothetical protein